MLFILVIGFILLLFVIKNNNKNNKNNNRLVDIIKTLVRQSARWAIAAIQDKSPLIAVLHANYAAGYLWSLKDIASSEEIKQASGVNLLQLERKITHVQDMATKRMSSLCPQYTGQADKFLMAVAGDI